MLKVFLLVYSLIFIQKGLALEEIRGVTGDELKIECSIEGDACLFTSARGKRVCAYDGDTNCERHQGIKIKRIGNVCHLSFSPLEDEHYGQWSCQDETWYGDIEILKTFEISPPMELFVEMTDYFGDVYFQRGDGLNISCHVSVDSEKEYMNYPGSSLQWRVGNEVISNDNPYVQTDVNQWEQILNYEPVMEDNHKRLTCYINENIEDQADGINLHMVDFEFHSQTIYYTLQENIDKEIIIESDFKSYPEPRVENVFWKVGGIKLHPGETNGNGFSSTKIMSTGDSEYTVKLNIPPDSIDMNTLLVEENYLSVDIANIREPFKVPIVFEKATNDVEAIIPVPPPIGPSQSESIVPSQPESIVPSQPESIVPSQSEPDSPTNSIQSTVSKLSNSSILGYILGGIIVFLVLGCCIGYYIYKCCCGKKDDDHPNNYYPKEGETKVLQPLTLDETTIVEDNIFNHNNSISILNGSVKEQKREDAALNFSTFTRSPDIEKENRKLTWSQINEGSYTTEKYNPAYRPANHKTPHLEISSNDGKELVKTKDPNDLPTKGTSVFYTESNQKSASGIEHLEYSQTDLLVGSRETSLVGPNASGNTICHSERNNSNQTNNASIETTIRGNTSMRLSSLGNQVEVVDRQKEIKHFTYDSERLPSIADSRDSHESGYRPIREHMSSYQAYTPLSQRNRVMESPQSGTPNNDECMARTNLSYTETNTLPKKTELLRQSSVKNEYNDSNRIARDTTEVSTFSRQSTSSSDEVDFNEANQILKESAMSLIPKRMQQEYSGNYYNQELNFSKRSTTTLQKMFQTQNSTTSGAQSPSYSTFKETLALPSNSTKKSSESLHSFYENVNNVGRSNNF
uniref:Ig-like domain-containing protein n=1 Tax=Lepeophtheirus salmonis TaxID=72036 RepID=A0A0K2T5K6_LEPSM